MRKLDLNFEEVLESSLEFGVPLPKKVRTSIRRKLEALQDTLPVNSNVELRYFNEGSKFRGSLKVRSLYQNFSSQSFSKDPLELFENLLSDIEEQVLNWKRNRFLTGNHLHNHFDYNNTAIIGGRR
ncbi:MAG: hypothetical protein ACJAT2_002207 [Bacteriovoracaceae bacterium]|jgi:hypothetical protein